MATREKAPELTEPARGSDRSNADS